jgi:hypothetical protein
VTLHACIAKVLNMPTDAHSMASSFHQRDNILLERMAANPSVHAHKPARGSVLPVSNPYKRLEFAPIETQLSLNWIDSIELNKTLWHDPIARYTPNPKPQTLEPNL